jgi:hypothetical protein
LAAGTLATTLLLNRGDHFEVRPLPREAQMAPVFGISVADFDGDGNEDIFLAQNFFGTRPEDARLDAGRGLLLRGDGKGGFAAVPGQESGIFIYGEQRGSAVGDFDEDGRPDLIVTQNGAATRLLHNVTAKPGLRVRGVGLGSMLRLRSAERLGPARLVGAGGYWSQDGLTAVLMPAGGPAAVTVTSSRGEVREIPVPLGAKVVDIR